MPKGWSRPVAKVAICAALPSGPTPRRTMTSPAPESERNRSPLGAVRIRRGSVKVPAAAGHVLDVVGTLHGRGVAAGVERDLEAGRRDGPGVGRARDDGGWLFEDSVA